MRADSLSFWTMIAACGVAACAGVIGDKGASENASPGQGKGSDNGGSGGPTDFGTETGNDPGRVTLHRLNRAEYNNTVRDLFGTSLAPADDFPVDDHGYNFDNIADVLSIPPTLVELYERAAERLVDEALSVGADPIAVTVEAETLSASVGAAGRDAYNMFSGGDLQATFTLPADGEYRVVVRLWGDQGGSEPARAQLRIGATDAGTFDVPNTSDSPLEIEGRATLPAGTRVVTVSFLNDYYEEGVADRNLHVDYIRLEGPLDAAPPSSAQRDRIVVCDPEAEGDPCLHTILETFASRAWRRPAASDEVSRLMTLVDVARAQGEGMERGLALALRATLLSPHFVFRVEIDPDPSSTSAHPLDDYELASRLSYFLWSSMPDEDLFAAAAAGTLRDPEVLASEARRMLADDKAEALIDNFAGQWLFTRAIDEHEPDYNYFPEYDDGLREAVKAETRLFFRELLDQKLPVEQLLQADFTYVDERLAQHYGLPSPGGSGFHRVALATEQRGGLLRHAGILTVTSYPTRTSPVKRGKWVLAQLLCSEPPPPPPDVEADLPKEAIEASSIREVLAQHRAKDECAVCHNQMDPVGLALENFDGIGKWRSEENGTPIDATGVLPDGTALDGPATLADAVAADPRFPACVVEQLYTYALGRGIAGHDRPYLEALVEGLGGGGFSLEDAVVAIAQSEPFRMRRGETQ